MSPSPLPSDRQPTGSPPKFHDDPDILPRGLTHAKKLYAPETWVQRIGACWHELGEKRAVLLVQLAPDDQRLGYFLGRLRPWMRASVEFRHPSWHDEHVFAILEHHQAAYCVMSGSRSPVRAPRGRAVRFVRLHSPNPDHLYAGTYSDADLTWWADRIREWHAAGKDVFAYFNNDGHGNAVRNAVTLRHLLNS